MKLTGLLGKRLKDDEILEVLEHYDMEVIYAFDRTHEGMPDQYWAQAKPHGFQLGFDEHQVLNVVFCYVAPSEGFSPIDSSIIGAPVHRAFGEAESYCKQNSLAYRVSDPSRPGWWLKVEGSNPWLHYQFKDNRIFRVTLSSPK